MGENHGGVYDGGDDLQGATALGALLDVDWRTGTPGMTWIDQMGGGLRNAPGATARAEAATLATATSVSWAQSAQRRRHSRKGIEFVFDEFGQA